MPATKSLAPMGRSYESKLSFDGAALLSAKRILGQGLPEVCNIQPRLRQAGVSRNRHLDS